MQKRILSIILSLSIVASLFAGLTFSVSAAPTSATTKTDAKGNTVYIRNKDLTSLVSDATWDVLPAKSLIRTKVPEKVYYYINESFKTNANSSFNGVSDVTFGKLAEDGVSSGASNLTRTDVFSGDTQIVNSVRLKNGMFVLYENESSTPTGLVNSESDQYIQFNYELDAPASIESFFFGSDRTSSSAWQPGHWKFYVADTEAELFDDNNCVAEMDMATDGTLYRTAKTVLSTPATGKWVGVRLICAYRTTPTTAKGSTYIRIDHLSVQGTYANAVDVNAFTATSEGDDGTAGAAVTATAAGLTDKADVYGAAELALSAKESYTSEVDGKNYEFLGWYNGEDLISETATATYTTNGTEATTTYVAKYGVPSYTVTFVGKDGSTIDIQTVEHGSAATAPTAPYVAGSVFTGWDVAFDNITADTTVTAQYKTPTHTSATTKTDVKGNKVYVRNQTMTNLVSDATWDVTPAQSLIRGKTPEKAYYYINESYKDNANSYLSQDANLTFGKVAEDTIHTATGDLTSTDDFSNDTHIVTKASLNAGMFVLYENESTTPTALVNSEEDQYIQINYELDGEATIDSFFFGSDRSAGSWQPGHWKFYVADTEDELFIEDNCVAEMDMATDGTAYRTAKTVLSTPATGKWVGVRIICAYRIKPTQPRNNTYIRIDHLSVQGAYTNAVSSVDDSVLTVAKDAAVEAIDEIVVSKSDVSYGNSDRYGNYGSAKATVTATEEVTVDNDEYKFIGWSKGGEIISTDAQFEYDLANGAADLVATYDVTVYHTVSFMLYGQERASLLVKHGEAIPMEYFDTVVAVPTGYVDNWHYEEGTLITEDTVLTCTRSKIKYNVTYYVDGEVYNEQQVAYQENAIVPEAPVKEGYNFLGWDKDGTNITEDTEINAMFELAAPTTYTVTFVDWDGAEISTQTVEYGAPATAPADPTRVGYNFTGWDVAFDNITGDITVTAQYTIKSFTVTFVGFGGEELKKETVNYGAAATAPTDIDVPGFEFTGWDVAFDNITGDITVTAEYKEIFYTVTLKDAKGVLAEFTVKAGESVLDADVMAIEDSISDVYGYTVMKDDNDRVIWNGDVTAPIGADTTFEVRYQRDDSLKTAVTVTLVDGTKVYDNATLAYDTAIVAEDASAVAWLMDGVVVATGSSLKLYACGGTMNIVATTDAQAALDVAIVGKVVEDNQFSVFAHVNAANVVSYGIIFASGSYGPDNITLDLVDDYPTKLRATQADANGKTDFMATLVQSKAIGTKYARAFVVYADNTVAYSNVVVSQ